MDSLYKSYLHSLQLWVHDIEVILQQRSRPNISNDVATGTCQLITSIATCIQTEYPFYANELRIIANTLFLQSATPFISIDLNHTAYGKLALIERHLNSEPINMQFWSYIHPRICNVSRTLYADGHFSSAAEKAIVEVETRLRELFRELKPNSKEPAKVGEIMGALLTEDGAYCFADLSTPSGKNYRRGIQAIFEGAFAAYRNPTTHENLDAPRRESIEQIVLASQLMYVLDSNPKRASI